MFMSDFAMFVDFAEAWPKFLKNPALITKLLSLTGEMLDLDSQIRLI
jgi:hypothetical protein